MSQTISNLVAATLGAALVVGAIAWYYDGIERGA